MNIKFLILNIFFILVIIVVAVCVCIILTLFILGFGMVVKYLFSRPYVMYEYIFPYNNTDNNQTNSIV